MSYSGFKDMAFKETAAKESTSIVWNYKTSSSVKNMQGIAIKRCLVKF